MGKKVETVKGTITDIRFHNEENGYTVAVFETDSSRFNIVGNMISPARNDHLSLTGSFETHSKYGEQFRFTEYEEVMPGDAAAIEKFLSSGNIKGIGKKYAAAIVAMYGDETFGILGDEEKLMKVDGIGKKKAEKIAGSFREHREFAEISAELLSLGIKTEHAVRIYKEYGAGALDAVRSDPYRLVDDIYGIGFKTADDIAAKTGIRYDDPKRIATGTMYTLKYYTAEGNTYLPLEELAEKAGQLLDVSREAVKDILTDLTFAGDVTMATYDGVDVVYLTALFLAEQKVAYSLKRLAGSECKYIGQDIDSLVALAEAKTGLTLGEMQRKAVKTAVEGSVTVITGGPGTGKTTIINTIIRVFYDLGHTVKIAAPTGRAAKRITETSGYDAMTIHRLLEYAYDADSDYMYFGKDEDDPLDCDCIIVDEASMIDLMLMEALVKAIRPGTRLIIVGDKDQLPPVGAGNVLKDMIESGTVTTVMLTEIYRQAAESFIVTNAHRINRGEYPYCNDREGEFFFLTEPRSEQIAEKITGLVTKRLPSYYKDLDMLRDIQVLTPAKKGILGTGNLNRLLQEALNPPDETKKERVAGDKVFRVGDKVMQIRNDYAIHWRRTTDLSEGQGIFNGDVGFIRDIDKDRGVMGIVFDEDKYVNYGFDMLFELELAYAITVHKSQGSEFPVVVMPMAFFPPMLATRNLLYTAVTRSREAVVLVGTEDRMRQMVDNDRIVNRYSGLKYMLCDMTEV